MVEYIYSKKICSTLKYELNGGYDDEPRIQKHSGSR